MASQLSQELLKEDPKVAVQCVSLQSASTEQEHALYEHQHAPKVTEYQYQQQCTQERGATQRAQCGAYKEDKMTKLAVAVFDQMCLLDPQAQDVSSGPRRVTLEQGDKASCSAAPFVVIESCNMQYMQSMGLCAPERMQLSRRLWKVTHRVN